MVSKTILSGWVLLIPPKYSILRVTFALLLCLGLLVVILAGRPYRMLQRNLAASVACLSLFVTFLAVLFVKIHAGIDDAEADASKVFGFSTVLPFTIVLLVFNFLVLAWVIAFVVIELLRLRSLPRIRLRSTHEIPLLRLPPGQRFHCFMSHAWGTGQDQTHAVVRHLQLLMPTVKVWLDVEQLDDVGRLEENVRESAICCIFLSKGFFASKNCRRELFTALAARKPLILIHETDEAKGGATLEEMKQECIQHCTDAADLTPSPPALDKASNRKSAWQSARAAFAGASASSTPEASQKQSPAGSMRASSGFLATLKSHGG
jgi:hypothetical protein